MRLTYDPEADAAYIQLRSGREKVRTVTVTPDCNIDIASDGRVFEIELLNAKKQLAMRITKKMVAENQQSGKKSQVRLPF